jgi:hypothetical protein
MLQQDVQYEGPEIDSVGGGLRRKLRLQSGDLVRLGLVGLQWFGLRWLAVAWLAVA